MAQEDKKVVAVIAIRAFATHKGSHKVGEKITTSKAEARAFVRRKAAAYEGTVEAEAALGAAKEAAKKK